jgi:copper transport protein
MEVAAHATLIGTTPPDAAILATNPQTVTLAFNEAVAPIAITLVRPDGTLLPLTAVAGPRATLSIDLPGELTWGSHALSWRAVSEDGHPISGTLFFSIGTASALDASEDNTEFGATEFALWFARLLVFIALFFGVGGAAFRLLDVKLPNRAVRLILVLLVVGLLAAVTAIGLQGLDLLGAGLASLGSTEPWLLGFKSPYGTTMLLACLSFLLGFGTLRAKVRTVIRALGVAGLGCLGLAVAASGHASAADPQWLTRSALFLHVTSIAWWLGALYPLILLLRQDRRTATPPLVSFSRAIPFAIAPLLASGIALAVVQLGPPSPAWGSAYGLILAGKLSLLAVLFCIASWNRWVLTAPAAAGDQRALRRMRRGIDAEIIIIVAVLGLVSGWRFTPPPRALEPDTASLEVADIDLSNARLKARIQIQPARAGIAKAQIVLSSASGEVLRPKSIQLRLEPTKIDIAPLTFAAVSSADGLWTVDQVMIPVPGEWSIEVAARVSDFDLVKLQGTVQIAPVSGTVRGATQ